MSYWRLSPQENYRLMAKLLERHDDPSYCERIIVAIEALRDPVSKPWHYNQPVLSAVWHALEAKRLYHVRLDDLRKRGEQFKAVAAAIEDDDSLLEIAELVVAISKETETKATQAQADANARAMQKWRNEHEAQKAAAHEQAESDPEKPPVEVDPDDDDIVEF